MGDTHSILYHNYNSRKSQLGKLEAKEHTQWQQAGPTVIYPAPTSYSLLWLYMCSEVKAHTAGFSQLFIKGSITIWPSVHLSFYCVKYLRYRSEQTSAFEYIVPPCEMIICSSLCSWENMYTIPDSHQISFPCKDLSHVTFTSAQENNGKFSPLFFHGTFWTCIYNIALIIY